MSEIINGVGRVGWRNYTPISSIISNGLILNLDASNTSSYAGTGTTWTDLSGNGNHGTLINGPAYSTTNGGSFAFDGINDYVETNYIQPSNANLTYGIWGKLATSRQADGYGGRIMGNADYFNGYTGIDIIWGSLGKNTIHSVRRGGPNGDMAAYGITNLSINWHYLVVTYNATTGSKLYCDGIQVASNGNIGFTATLSLKIGNDGNGPAFFIGNIGAAHVYDRALSATEVATNFNTSKTRFGL
jgi:hypothetical protein